MLKEIVSRHSRRDRTQAMRECPERSLSQYRSVGLMVRSTVITGVAGRGPLPHQHKGVCYAFSLDRNLDYCGHRCDLFLGHRKICQGWPFGKPAQIAGGADLLGGNPATAPAAGGNRLVLTVAQHDA